MGSNSAYLYIGFPSERGSEDLSRFDYDFFQLERAASEGVSVDTLGEQPGPDCWHFPRVDVKAAASTVCSPAFLKKIIFYCVKIQCLEK